MDLIFLKVNKKLPWWWAPGTMVSTWLGMTDRNLEDSEQADKCYTKRTGSTYTP